MSELTIQLLEDVHMNWSANLHLHFMQLKSDFDRFRNDIKTRALQLENGDINEIEQNPVTKDKSKWYTSVCLKGDISLEIYISEQHLMNICAGTSKFIF